MQSKLTDSKSLFMFDGFKSMDLKLKDELNNWEMGKHIWESKKLSFDTTTTKTSSIGSPKSGSV